MLQSRVYLCFPGAVESPTAELSRLEKEPAWGDRPVPGYPPGFATEQAMSFSLSLSLSLSLPLSLSLSLVVLGFELRALPLLCLQPFLHWLFLR
jgi:hypothetical protein